MISNNYKIESVDLQNGRIQLFRILSDATPMTFNEVIDCWITNRIFLDFYVSIFQNCNHEAYVWECPPISNDTMNRTFEFVIIKTIPYFSTHDDQTFERYFSEDSDDDGIVTFPNLGHDAQLVVPTPLEKDINYSSIASFHKEAPDKQQLALWRTTGLEIKRLLSVEPMWLSVAGGGVAWLHIRLDKRPKYYRFTEWKNYR